jgi:hypothetical protein
VDSRGKTETNMTGRKNYDWLLADADLEPHMTPVRFPRKVDEAAVEGKNMFSRGLVFDSASFPKLDDARPVQKGDSRAPGMQHLPVIKDFVIPVEKAVAPTQPASPK